MYACSLYYIMFFTDPIMNSVLFLHFWHEYSCLVFTSDENFTFRSILHHSSYFHFIHLFTTGLIRRIISNYITLPCHEILFKRKISWTTSTTLKNIFRLLDRMRSCVFSRWWNIEKQRGLEWTIGETINESWNMIVYLFCMLFKVLHSYNLGAL